MEFTEEEMLQLLEILQVPEETETIFRDLMAKGDYPELYRYLRSIRGGFLEELHLSQKRLDRLVYEIKKKNESQAFKPFVLIFASSFSKRLSPYLARSFPPCSYSTM